MKKKSGISPLSGYSFTAWVKLLARYRFAVGPRHLHRVVGITLFSAINSLLGVVERAVYGHQIARARIHPAPLFIIGHWRTGTTHLHELLTLDPNHTFPNTYECFVPNHFLLTEGTLDRLLHRLLPTQRQMDNMAFGFERPQEDEFALCAMGIGSPYPGVFPNSPPYYEAYMYLDALSPRDLERWKADFIDFLKRLSIHRPGRFVLKSPHHSCRVKVLLQMFPDAQFVHIVRNPYEVFPSEVNNMKTFLSNYALQTPRFDLLEENVFHTFLRMYRKIDEARELVDPSHFYELRYEDLIADPLGQLQAIYDHLNLGSFDSVRPAVERYLESIAGYSTNRYELSDELRAEITRRLGAVIEQYGYSSTSGP